jgi:serine/threonine protein kinase
VTTKIIDLGLAKPAPGALAEAAIYNSRSLCCTPEFASPERFAGVPVDIRSDLYSAWRDAEFALPAQREVQRQRLARSATITRASPER